MSMRAEYQGRDVKLGKIMQGDVKKFKVYVKTQKVMCKSKLWTWRFFEKGAMKSKSQILKKKSI